MSHAAAPGHRPRKKGHRILRALADAPERLGECELQVACDVRSSAQQARKFSYILRAMCRQRLIGCGWSNEVRANLYFITDAGRDALARLDRGEIVDGDESAQDPPVRPTVRLFRRDAA
jgi:hypothetical protein